MGRVHGVIRIVRRNKIEQRSKHTKYKSELREDFSGICGYCGKLDIAVKEDFQIDHFVPQKVDPIRANDYYNLVYSCRICNRNKWHKWPTNDKDKPNDGEKGFVDPGSEEFDKHLYRENSGEIKYKSNIGKYMYDELKIGTRPIKLIWKLMRFQELKTALKIKIEKDPDDFELHKKYYDVNEKIEEIVNFLYLRR